jgi:hypothetical protein
MNARGRGRPTDAHAWLMQKRRHRTLCETMQGNPERGGPITRGTQVTIPADTSGPPGQGTLAIARRPGYSLGFSRHNGVSCPARASYYLLKVGGGLQSLTQTNIPLFTYILRQQTRRNSMQHPSALPIEVFWHVVYSWICKHLYLYARSRRTSGQHCRPDSGLRPPLRYAAARSSWPVPRGSRRPPWPATCSAPTRRCAIPFMRSTSAALRGSNRNHPGRIPHLRSSPLESASPCGRCCTRVPGHSASPRAGGRSHWPPRSVSPRG